jgi:hypothetical protein
MATESTEITEKLLNGFISVFFCGFRGHDEMTPSWNRDASWLMNTQQIHG